MSAATMFSISSPVNAESREWEPLMGVGSTMVPSQLLLLQSIECDPALTFPMENVPEESEYLVWDWHNGIQAKLLPQHSALHAGTTFKFMETEYGTVVIGDGVEGEIRDL